MSLWLAIVGLGLFGVAASGALAPFYRRGAPTLHRSSDPLDDERLSLVRSLRELEEDRASGVLREQDYRSLRADTEGRAVAVLREIAAHDGHEGLREGLREIREIGRAPRVSASRRAAILLGAAVMLAWSIPLLTGSLSSREAGQPITGDLGPGASAQQPDPLAFFEQRVQAHPNDAAARLDLAHRYLDLRQIPQAIDEYVAALRLDPENAEAHAHLGLLLFLAGRTRVGLSQVEEALSVDPEYPEALYIKGLILLKGLARERQAASILERYLEVAPFGGERDLVARLLDGIRGPGTSAGPDR